VRHYCELQRCGFPNFVRGGVEGQYLTRASDIPEHCWASNATCRLKDSKGPHSASTHGRTSCPAVSLVYIGWCSYSQKVTIAQQQDEHVFQKMLKTPYAIGSYNTPCEMLIYAETPPLHPLQAVEQDNSCEVLFQCLRAQLVPQLDEE
jgi:hypothetical protein